MDNETKRIFVIGTAHTGTTILYKMLAYHPELAWFCQYSQRQKPTIPGRFLLPGSVLIKRSLHKVLGHDWQKGRDSKIVPCPSEANSLWDYLWGIDDLDERKRKIKEILDDESASWGRKPILVKNPNIGMDVELIADALGGDGRFIHITRNGRALVQSILPKFETEHSGGKALDATIDYWLDFYGKVTAFGEKTGWQNIMEIRYEDLVKDVHGSLKRIMNFCRLDEAAFPYKKIPGNLKSTNHKWINEKNRDKIRRIEDRGREMLARHDYL